MSRSALYRQEEGLTREQVERVKRYRECLLTLGTSSLMLGSWVGLAQVLLYFPAALGEQRRQRSRAARSRRKIDAELLQTVANAAARASDDSWIGQRSRRLVEREADDRLAGVA